jgi:hypothetical protein
MNAEHSLRKLAAQLGVGHTTIANWESGLRAFDPDDFDRLDQATRAGGTLRDLLWASTTPLALAPREVWTANLSGPNPYLLPVTGLWRLYTPSWVWLREADEETEQVAVRLMWGPLVLDIDTHAPGGLLVTTLVSMSNPPIVVRFRRTGWADFGRGQVPDGFGLDQVSGLSLMRRRPTPDFATAAVTRRIRSTAADASGWEQEVVRFTGHDTFVAVALEEEEPTKIEDLRDHEVRLWAPASTPDQKVERGNLFRKARRGRGQARAETDRSRMTWADAAAKATALWPEEPISAHQVDRLEDGGSSDAALILARLDVVYGAGGLLACEQLVNRDDHDYVVELEALHPGKRLFAVEFPHWWVGPVWIRFERSPRGEGVVTLRWWPWKKSVSLRTGHTVACRRSSADEPPLKVEAPVGWRLIAGLGHNPAAYAINDNWVAQNDAAVEDIIRPGMAAYLYGFGRRQSEANALGATLRRTVDRVRPTREDAPRENS